MSERILVLDGVKYNQVSYDREIGNSDDTKALQDDIKRNFKHIFKDMICIEEMSIESPGIGKRIPDLYALDVKAETLYIIEVELLKHGRDHILQQIDDFYSIYKNVSSRRAHAANINNYLRDHQLEKKVADKDVLETITRICDNYRVVVIIDEITEKLISKLYDRSWVVSKPLILEFKKYKREDAGVFIYEMDTLANNGEVSKANKVLTTNPVKRCDITDLIERGSIIYMKYKGRIYTATIESEGIKLENGSLKKTPSGAAKEIMRTNAADGWKVWYQDKECKKPLDLLRRNK